jgi:chromosome segregation protein
VKLKSLEIKGFKSFADKTQVILDNPITGIVGPNGCGKSNIIDAIRWVIGEHKIKSLRSDNLLDLIFNGSKSRSPSGMAEVSLTFENTRNLLPTEFTTVTITRKFFRTGDSEYRLNDVACRLKDIHNLFLDTGVSNDSYAIIELGMVDDIIKDKEGSRRRMLEQAAGISIYKTRKKEAKQKLDATMQDIARIDDLLFEIGNNLRTLESQAKKAEKYIQIKKDYKEISIELAKASLSVYNDKYKSLNEELEREQDKKLRIETEIAGDEAEIEANKLVLVQKEQELALAQRKFNELLNSIRHIEGEKKLASQRLDYLQEREKSLHQSISQSTNQIDIITSSKSQSFELIAIENEKLEDLRDQLETIREQLEDKRLAYDEKRKSLENAKQSIIAIQKQQFDLEKQVAVSDTSSFNLQRTIQQLKEEKLKNASQIDAFSLQLTNTQQLLEEKQEHLLDLEDKQAFLKENILEAQAHLEELRSALIAENRQLDAKKNEFKLLKSLVDSLEGYPESIKFLKKSNNWNNQAPLVSDVFVVQPEYRTALEFVLDQYLNYYIVDTYEEAIQAIHLLDKEQKGKANFFILNQFDNISIETSNIYNNTTAALNVVTVDSKYQQLAQHLLGHVFIAHDEEAIANAELMPNHVILSKGGNTIKGKFKMGGGSVGAFEGNKIGRSKNLELLSDEIVSIEAKVADWQQQIQNSQLKISGFTQSLVDKDLEKCKNEINALQNEIFQVKNKMEHFGQLDERNIDKISDLQEQLQQIIDNTADAKSDLETVNDEIDKILSDIKLKEADFASIEQDYNLVSRQFNDLNISVTRQQSKIENMKQELSFRDQQLTDLEQQKVNFAQQLQEVAAQISEANGKLHFGDNELYDLLQKKEKDEKTLNENDKAYYELRNAITEHENKISRQRREKEQAESLLNSVREKLGDMKLAVAGMKERLFVEFRIELDEILEEELKTELREDELKEEVDRLKKRLDNMGEVNPTAIEAYNEMKVRYDFIIDQKQDLIDAQNTLLATIEEVEMTANAKFKETFDQVRENFVQVFKALFTEDDNADLRLTDPDNVAESGIEIYAQPKGKRPSTLTQLSGGEKTLTSTAFLFAIYLIKPAPFCILDEVDAPLDDANVAKFTQMIRKFSDNSQFIIVTHNKQTMASVDVIYGVTMQEAGVSKIVPVDFRSLEDV